MSLFDLIDQIPNQIRRRRRESALAAAANWPIGTAKLLSSTVVPKDPSAEEGTAFQTSQIESAFYFTVEGHEKGSYFGGHLRSTPVSDSEAHRLLHLVPEGTPVRIRFNPTNPDQTHTYPTDNPNFPFTIWPM